LQIGDWIGMDLPLAEAVVDATGSDAYINRRYSRRNGLETISAFIACGTRINEVMSHRPLGCYRTAGWQLMHHRAVELPWESGKELPCILYQWSRQGPDTEYVTVLHYCYADGRYFNEVKRVLAAGWRGLKPIDYAAQVQIVVPGRMPSDDAATKLATAFAVESAPAIARVFEQIEKDQGWRQ